MLHELTAATGMRTVFYYAFGERSAGRCRRRTRLVSKSACHTVDGIAAWNQANGPLAP